MPFILGIARGSSICLIACAPGIIPYLISKQYGWRKSLQLAVLFNLPRIILLSVLGIIVGIIGFSLKELITSLLPQIFIPIQTLGYGLLGIFILIFGAYMFTTSIEAHENLKEAKEKKVRSKNKNAKENDKPGIKGTCVEEPLCTADANEAPKSGILAYVKKKFNYVQARPDRLFLLWGGIMSIACLGEIILIELSVISGSFGLISNSPSEAALLGGAAMFLFAVGASIPIIIAALVANPIGKIVRARGSLETVRTVFGIVMIMVGMGFIYILISFLVASV
jgi:sulfite exporter TauE/SafE